MTKFQRWVLRKIFAKLVVQGPKHGHNLTEVYELLIEATFNEFTEDSHITLYHFNRDCFDIAFKKVSD